MARDFRKLLLNISENLTAEDLTNMKFLCANEIPRGRMDAIRTPLSLLDALVQVGVVSQHDLSYLDELLASLNYCEVPRDKLRTFQATQLPHRPTTKRGLPRKIRRFVGRDGELEDIMNSLDGQNFQMSVIVAPPGYGKSALATQVGHAMYEKKHMSVLYVSLRKLTSLESLATEILHGLEISPGSNRIHQTQNALVALEQETLLILDNAEDLLQTDGDGTENKFRHFVQYLGLQTTFLRLLVTSRKKFPLLSFEYAEVKLKPLSASSSAELLKDQNPRCNEFAERLGLACGGIPLLLRIVASRIRDSYDPSALLNTLKDNPIAMLKTGDANSNEYYSALLQFLRSCLGKDLLRALIRVSVFPTRFKAEDAMILFESEPECRSILAQLVGNALLHVDDASYSLHPFIQSLCRTEAKKIKFANDARRAVDKFNTFYLDLLKKTAKGFMTKNCKPAIDKFRSKEMNIVHAVRNSLQAERNKQTKIKCLDICARASNFLAKVMTSNDCHKLLTDCSKTAAAMNDRKRYSQFLTSLGFRHMLDSIHLNSNPRAIEALDRAYGIQMNELTSGERECETHAHCMSKLGLCYTLQGEMGEGIANGEKLINKAVELRRRLGNRVLLAAGCEERANAYRHRGRYHEAIEILTTDVLPVYTDELGDHPFTANALNWLGICFLKLQDYIKAEQYTRKALHMRESLLGSNDQDVLRSTFQLGQIFNEQGKLSAALKTLIDTMNRQEKALGCHPHTVKSCEAVAEIYEKLGDKKQALEVKTKARQYTRELDEKLAGYQMEQSSIPQHSHHQDKPGGRNILFKVSVLLIVVCLVCILHFTSFCCWSQPDNRREL